LILSVSPDAGNDRMAVPEIRDRVFAPNSASPLSEIISHLTSVSSRNAHDLGVLVASSSGVIGSSNEAKHPLDLQNRGSFSQSNGQTDGWICGDFKKMRGILTHCSILLFLSGLNGCHPKSWSLEVSDDGNSWTEVHRIRNSSDLNGQSQIGTYEMNKSAQCRFVRLRQTEKEPCGRDYFSLSSIEIFGTLCEP
jgi:hypothetical protein